ncbi:MAG: biotin--[acetyl-CoA-carboxylase] ligase [Dehalococcoidales bacterium]|nr:biotin--[acetyl-CoA-carboxylase] ligase [Dehalococcoidales bacterium]
MVSLPESIRKNLSTHIVGRNILYFPSVTSTNDVAKEIARKQVIEGTVVIADEQTAGKGRLNRTWTSPEGVIAYSAILNPSVAQLPLMIMIASLSVVHAIRNITGIKARIKWPNDVQIDGKKVCGILIENSLRGGKVEYSVIGIGINANVNTVEYPEIAETATSLSFISGREIPKVDLIQGLMIELDKLYLSMHNSKSIFEEWRDNLVTIGQYVRAVSGDTVYEGTAESVKPDGSLLIKQAGGNIIQVVQGDVTLKHKT